jgi:hypothetical protein
MNRASLRPQAVPNARFFKVPKRLKPVFEQEFLNAFTVRISQYV